MNLSAETGLVPINLDTTTSSTLISIWTNGQPNKWKKYSDSMINMGQSGTSLKHSSQGGINFVNLGHKITSKIGFSAP